MQIQSFSEENAMSVIAIELNLEIKGTRKQKYLQINVLEWKKFVCVQQGLSEDGDSNPGGFGG